jgi:DNA mismatch repair ATPase MutL
MMEDLSLHILDIAENAIAAGAKHIAITVRENQQRDRLTIRIADDGKGMSKSALKKAVDPFFTTKGKKTGLGLALLAQAAQMSDGGIRIESRPKKGTRVEARFRYSHIDRPALSKMAETMMTLVLSHPEIDFGYRHWRNGRAFSFTSKRFKKISGGAATTEPEVIGSVERVLKKGLASLGRT